MNNFKDKTHVYLLTALLVFLKHLIFLAEFNNKKHAMM